MLFSFLYSCVRQNENKKRVQKQKIENKLKI
jgi:hypothetical protein